MSTTPEQGPQAWQNIAGYVGAFFGGLIAFYGGMKAWIARRTGERVSNEQVGHLFRDVIRKELEPINEKLGNLETRIEDDRRDLYRRLNRAGVPGFGPHGGGD